MFRTQFLNGSARRNGILCQKKLRFEQWAGQVFSQAQSRLFGMIVANKERFGVLFSRAQLQLPLRLDCGKVVTHG